MEKSTAKASDKTEDTFKKRRLLNIGPGLIIALILSVVVGYKYVNVQKQIGQQSKMPPIVERQRISSNYEEKSGPTPEVRFIIDRREKLGLNDSQVGKLEKVQSDWVRFYQPKMAAANAAADKTNKYLADAKNNRRTPVAQIQNDAGPVIALSGEISSARRDYWGRAVKILTPDQRAVIQKEREADWAAKMKKISDNVRQTVK